ncbi:MAG TPA: hypothetical protein DGT23_27020 [Micromonosporaceae bacterium]|nr:hypothetical protein [Micromonosporaceae bacterium]
MSDIAEPVEVVSVRRSKTPLILAGAVAVALVLGIGAYVGYRFLFGGAQPAERMPASVIAYAAIDLTPGLDQTNKLRKLLEKFPSQSGNTDPKAAIEKLLQELDIEGVDPKRDLASWLGLRAAVGLWLDSRDDPYAVVAVASTDDEAAKKGLTVLRDKSKASLGFVVRDGYALVAIGDKDAQRAADAAEAEAQKSPLAKATKYVEARKWLADEQLTIVYADLSAYGRLMKSFMGKDLLEGEDPETTEQFQKMLDEQSKNFTGTVIAGARIEDDGIVSRSRSFGAKAITSGTVSDAIGKLGALPASSEIAAVAKVPDDLDKSPFATFGLPFALTPGLGAAGTPLTEAEQKELEALMDKDFEGKLTDAEQKRLDELMAKMPGFGGSDLTPAQEKELDALLAKDTLTAAEQKRLEELFGGPGAGASKAWEELFGVLSGATVTVSVAGVADKPVFRALAELTTAPSAKTVTELTKLSDGDVKVTVEGKTLTATSPSYSAAGKLADDALFQRCVSGAPANVQLAVYVNLAKAVPAKWREKLGPFKAFSVMQGTEQGDQIAVARVLIG